MNWGINGEGRGMGGEPGVMNEIGSLGIIAFEGFGYQRIIGIGPGHSPGHWYVQSTFITMLSRCHGHTSCISSRKFFPKCRYKPGIEGIHAGEDLLGFRYRLPN